MRVFLYTSFALTAFAFNSILCRLALRGDEADAAGFTAVRLASGAVALGVISYLAHLVSSPTVREGSDSSSDSAGALTYVRATDTGNWPSAFFLFAYAICFSFAYLGLTAGTGALILFGSVQLTMVVAAIFMGERPPPLEWIGMVTALGGLVYLVFPGLASPPLISSILMAAAGMSWAVYTLRGRTGNDPLANTTGNFVRSLPMAATVAVLYFPNLHLSTRGLILAVLSGAVTSGIGYTIWYAALKYHTSTRAAVLQLAVPVIAAALGIMLLGESANLRLVLASILILGGIAVVIIGRNATVRA